MYPRTAQKNDYHEVKSLWEYCFDDSTSFNTYYFSNRYDPQNTIVIPETGSGKLLAALQLNQYQLSFGKKEIPVSYIIGVSTLPENRGSGLMKRLLPFALQKIYNRGQAFAIMMAIDSRLYKKYQFNYIADKSLYSLKTANCSNERSSFQLIKADRNNCSDLAGLYNMFHQQHYITLYRDRDYFTELLAELASEDFHIYLIKDTNLNRYTGYVIYALEENCLHIREWCYLNKATLYRILGFIYQHNMQVENVRINTSSDDYLKHIIPVNNSTEINLLPFMMGRIINVKKFFNYEISSKENLEVNILIKDNFLLHNAGIYCLTAENHCLTAQKKEPDAKYQVECDIATLTQLACGYLPVEMAYQMDCLQVYNSNALAVLRKMFPAETNFVNEYI